MIVHPYPIELGTEIRKLRNQRKLTLETLGGDIGIDASNHQKIESGHNVTFLQLHDPSVPESF